MTFPNLRSSPLRYLILAAAIHIGLTTAIFLIGHFRLLPNTFDENGIGLTFAIDGTSYQRIATALVEEWQTNGFRAWLHAKAPLHSRLHSLSFVVFGKFLGHNILGAEPLNLFYYLSILICVYLLGREIFSARAGLLAAAIVGVWPSFLLHSTQLIRDPLSILCLLALMLVLVSLLSREFAWEPAVGLGIGGAVLVTLFWLARGNMWNVILAAVTIAVAILACRMIRERRFMAGNAVVMLLIIVAALLVPSRLESTTLPGVRPPITPLAIPSASQPAPPEGIGTTALVQIAQRRAGFRFYASHSSDIDSHVRFASTGDIVRFVPRAFVVGLFAPFPEMWLEPGTFGRTGRLLSGIETLAMYVFYLATALCLWEKRRNLKMWLLFLVATIGVLALGLVVVNAGALFRIRYVFWMMLIVMAAEGVLNLRQAWNERSLFTGFTR
jgi:4-amino-4-deoxy-L-arabinose transferase-like glycosyltransferase